MTTTPITVSTTTGVWTAVGSWLGAIGIGAVLVAIVKSVVPWRKQVSEERGDDFARLRAEIAEAKAEAKEAAKKADDASKAVLRAQTQTAMLSAALSLVSAELERKDPGNPVIKQARDMVARAACEDVGFGADLRALSQFKGAGE